MNCKLCLVISWTVRKHLWSWGPSFILGLFMTTNCAPWGNIFKNLNTFEIWNSELIPLCAWSLEVLDFKVATETFSFFLGDLPHCRRLPPGERLPSAAQPACSLPGAAEWTSTSAQILTVLTRKMKKDGQQKWALLLNHRSPLLRAQLQNKKILKCSMIHYLFELITDSVLW